MLKVHSTRLFPKDLGANRYQLTGIASRCDWVVLSDKEAPQTHLIKREAVETPQTIFLSFRWQRVALRFFVETVLPQISQPFTLISGSEDVTIPNQIDVRMEQFNEADHGHVKAILSHPCLKAWVAENLDDASHPKLHPLPLGLIYNDAPQIRETVVTPTVSQLSQRPLKALCAHRVRPGGQWNARRRVTEFAKADWSDWCTVLEDDVSEADFIRHIESHTFVICVEGGGLDPSPKAWLALLHGAIPIIRSSSLDSAYKRLPVAIVEDWSAEALSLNKLTDWKRELSPHFDDPVMRQAVLDRLSLDYWWDYANSVGHG